MSLEDEAISIQIEGSGLTYKSQISRETAEQVIIMVITGAANAQGPTRFSQRDNSAPNEFVQKSNPPRHLDKITTLGLYLKRNRNQQKFTSDEIKKLYLSAGLAVPTTFAREVGKAVRAGFIAPGDDGSYYVTSTGEEAVDAAFAGDFSKPVRQNRKRRRAKDNGSSEPVEDASD